MGSSFKRVLVLGISVNNAPRLVHGVKNRDWSSISEKKCVSMRVVWTTNWSIFSVSCARYTGFKDFEGYRMESVDFAED
jgi:hypothetical protein